MSDGIYGRVFYFRTGFHGLHVLFGMVFITVACYLADRCYSSGLHCLSFEFAVVY